jgi:hypothetical protein
MVLLLRKRARQQAANVNDKMFILFISEFYYALLFYLSELLCIVLVPFANLLVIQPCGDGICPFVTLTPLRNVFPTLHRGT